MCASQDSYHSFLIKLLNIIVSKVLVFRLCRVVTKIKAQNGFNTKIEIEVHSRNKSIRELYIFIKIYFIFYSPYLGVRKMSIHNGCRWGHLLPFTLHPGRKITFRWIVLSCNLSSSWKARLPSIILIVHWIWNRLKWTSKGKGRGGKGRGGRTCSEHTYALFIKWLQK